MSSPIVNRTLLADHDVTQTAVDSELVDVDRLTPSTSTPFADAFLLEYVPFSKALYGYIAPFFVAATIVTNILVCLVLVRPGMRTATNAVLVAVAFSDSMTGLAPLPCYIYFYTLGGQNDYVPYRWCFWYFCLIDYLPTVFHTASVWLTVLLAAQRYVCVCRGDLPRARNARRRSLVVKVCDIHVNIVIQLPPICAQLLVWQTNVAPFSPRCHHSYQFRRRLSSLLPKSSHFFIDY